MFVLYLGLETNKYEDAIIHKRYGITRHVHNVIAKHANFSIEKLNNNEEYIKLKETYKELKVILSDEEFKVQIEPTTHRMNELVEEHGLTKNELEKFAKKQGKMFRRNLSSQQVQKEADRVYESVEEVLYGDGKKVHLKKYKDINTIGGKSPTNGVKLYSPFHKDYLNKKELKEVKYETQINWNGLVLKVKADYSDPYVLEAMQHEVSYCEIGRKMFMNGYHHYVIVYLKGDPPKKLRAGDLNVEIDPGVSTLAAYSEEKLMLEELAPKAKSYQARIKKLQREIDNCKRALNPQNYNPDGTVKKGRHKWKLSKTAKRKEREVTVLYRKEAAYRKDNRNYIANRVIEIGANVRSEPMNWKALQKRSKKTEREENKTKIKRKDGSEIVVNKFKRKKRFGSSLRTRDPSALEVSLQRKCIQYGGAFSYIDTRTIKPSQRDHASDEFIKTKARFKIIDGVQVQRDLYAAYIGYCTKSDGKTFDKEKALLLFKNFVEMQDKLIHEMKAQGISMPQCFGF